MKPHLSNLSGGVRCTLPARAAWVGLALLSGLAGPVRADGDTNLRAPLLTRYRDECSACHLAYPPGLLPASSWQRLMDNLPRHFGTDASLDKGAADEVSRWLIENAASMKKVRREGASPPEDRITRSAWFVREHHEIGADVWKRKGVGSPANCAACHTGAAHARFSEHDVRIPN